MSRRIRGIPRHLRLRPGDDVHGTGERSKEVRRSALQDLHALNERGGDRQVERIVPRVEVVETHAVEHDEHLVEGAAAHADIRLGTVDASRAHINPRQILQNICYGLDRQRLNLVVGDLRNEPIRIRLNFSFLRNHQHLLKTKLLAFGERGVLWNSLIRFDSDCSCCEHESDQCRTLAMLEHLQVGHVARHTPDGYLAVEGTKGGVRLVAKPTEAESTLF